MKPKLKATSNLQKSKDLRLQEMLEARSAYQDVLDLKLKTWALVRILMEQEQTLWTEEEILLWYKPLARNEGPGEAALRIRLGISADATYKPGDLVKEVDGVRTIYREVKSVDIVTSFAEHHVRETVQSIQTGSQGRHAFMRWHYLLSDAEKALVTEDLSDYVAIGEVTQARLPRLPADLKRSISLACAPSKSMGAYDGVYATTRHGFVFVPQADCDLAWELESVTKCGPKYVLSDDYLRRRIRATTEPEKTEPPALVEQQAA